MLHPQRETPGAQPREGEKAPCSRIGAGVLEVAGQAATIHGVTTTQPVLAAIAVDREQHRIGAVAPRLGGLKVMRSRSR